MTNYSRTASARTYATRIFFLVLILRLISANPVAAMADSPYFVWWGDAKELTYANIAAPGAPADIDYWRNRGGLDAGHIGLGSQELGYFDHGMAARMRARMEELAAGGYKSIALEIERGTDPLDVAALRDFKAAHPDIFVVAWLTGLNATHDYAALNRGIDLFMYEVYISYGHAFHDFDDFITLAKNRGILEKSIFALSTVPGTGEVTIESIEDQIAYIRNRAPRMPGLAFFHYRPDNIAWNQSVDRLCKKYFVDPVLTVAQDDIVFSNPAPVTDESLTVQATIKNIGATTSAPTAVVFYDGNPDLGGVLIGAATIGPTPRNSSSTASLNWKPNAGFHEIFVKIAGSDGATLLSAVAGKTIVASPVWWNSRWRYRVPIVVGGAPYGRKDTPIDQWLDFSDLLRSVANGNAFDANSIRLIEYTGNGDTLTETPSQFEPGADFNAVDKAQGMVTWIVKGDTPAGAPRHYYLYFDALGARNKAPAKYASMVTQTGPSFNTGYYIAKLDPAKGYSLSELTPKPGSRNVLGANGWSFKIADDSRWYRSGGVDVIAQKSTIGGVYTKFEVQSRIGSARLKTTYYFYGRGAPIKIRREFGPNPGSLSTSIKSAVELTGGIPERGGSWASGHARTESAGVLLSTNTREYYFGGPPGPEYRQAAGWFDWSWPASDNAGLGVAVTKRWSQTAAVPYDLTRYYDAQDYLQVWHVTDVTTTLPGAETSELYLVPHQYQDFTDRKGVSPAYKVWQQANSRPTTLFPVEAAPLTAYSSPPSAATATTVDRQPPAVKLSVRRHRPAASGGAAFLVRWRGYDPSGIASYTVIFKRVGSRKWRILKSRTASTHTSFTGALGRTYLFRAKARDAAGNLGVSKIKKAGL